MGLSWWSAEEHQDDLHLWLGYAVLFLVIFRIGWGFVGSSTARFSNFVRGPGDVLLYIRHRFRWPVAGHSPLGALSVVALLGLIGVQVGLGLFASDEDGLLLGPLSGFISGDVSEEITDLHEDVFNVLLGLIGLHIAAVLFYWVARKQNLIRPMLSGTAELDPNAEPMRPGKWWVALLCLAAGLAISRWVIAGVPPFSS